MKGSPPRELVVEQPGGQIGNTRVNVSGTISFRLQADYVFFLEPSKMEPSHYRLVGMAQGAFRILRDARTGMESVAPAPGEAVQGTFPGEAAGGRKVPPMTTLSQFRRQIERWLSQPLYVPRGTTFPVAIRALESRGVGRMQVLGQTVSDVHPDSGAPIPAGSAIEGTAQRVGNKWQIRWTDLSVGETHIQITATSEEMTGGSLRGRTLLVKVK
jgi:hypothetical protein